MPRNSAPPLPRAHLADGVFDALAKEILSGEIRADTELASERDLSERFGVSKLLVRQAVHRLAEAGLVVSRQGAKTRVLDPRTSTDLRLLDLYYRLAPTSAFARDLKDDILEKQYTQGLSLLDVFIRRASRSEVEDVAGLFSKDPRLDEDETHFARTEEAFWVRLAEGGKNRILLFEVRFWYRSLATRPSPDVAIPLHVRRAFYEELSRRLVSGDHPLEYYRDTLRPRSP